MNPILREHMLACTNELVNGLEVWAERYPDADLDAREEAVWQQGQACLRVLLEVVASAAAPRAAGRCPCCQVVSVRPVARQRRRVVLSRLGLVRLPRELVTCRSCGHSWAPVDRVLGLGKTQRMTRRVRLWLVQLGALAPFRVAAALLEDLLGLAVGPETLRRHTAQVGRHLEAQQQRALQQVEATQEAAEPLDPAPGLLTVQTDGVMVRFIDGWHEVKLGLVAGLLQGALQAVSYVAAREGPEPFGLRLLAEAARRGALEVVRWQGRDLRDPVLRTVLMLGDGAHWIWNLAAEHFGERTEIVDFYHACQHVWTVAKALLGEGTQAASFWAQARCRELLEHGAPAVLAALQVAKPLTPEAEKVLRVERGYFTRHAPRMAYPEFQGQGLPIGSGAVESAARHLVQHRMKRAGMRWSDSGGQAMLTLLAHLASSRDLPAAHLPPAA